MTSTVPYLTTETPPGQPSDAAADHNGEWTRPASGRNGSARSADRHGPGPDTNGDRTTPVCGHQRPLRSWPLLVLATPAAVAVWSGWVGIGQMTGFGKIRPLPGIWDSLHVDTAVTLPIGVEAYAAFALHVWLTSNTVVSHRTRRFARWSAIGALVLGMAGQVAYHLLTQAGVTRAPWEVTTLVSCLPVVVLGMGSSLAHLLRSDVANTRAAAIKSGQSCVSAPEAQSWTRPPSADHSSQDHPVVDLSANVAVSGHSEDGRARPPARVRHKDAQAAAAQLITSGQAISRRSLRSAGLHGSNADLGMLARRLRTASRG